MYGKAGVHCHIALFNSAFQISRICHLAVMALRCARSAMGYHWRLATRTSGPRMSLQHALLTSLMEKPSSGYELARRFDRSIGYFWHATHQQIYRELGRMADHGWIAASDHEHEGMSRPRRKVYRVLPAGRDELVRWVRSPTAGLDQRDEILVKLRADAIAGPLGLGDEMRRLMALHRERLDTYLAIEQRDFRTPQRGRAQRLQHALLRKGIRYEQDWLAWASEVLPLVELQADGPPPEAMLTRNQAG